MHRIASLCAALALPVALTAQLDAPTHGIDHHNRLLLVRAKATGKTDGIVLIATRLGATDSVLRSVVALGGAVRVRFDDVGYARVRLPLAQFVHVRAIPGVVEARIDNGYLSYGYDQGTDPEAIKLIEKTGLPKRDTAEQRTLPPLPATALTANNPYVPLANIGVPQLRAAHPTFDGRGVTIGVLEGGTLDFTHPSLQAARRLDGDSVVKISGIIDPDAFESEEVAAADAATRLSDDTLTSRTRVFGTGVIDASDGTFLLDGHRYQAPHPGRFHAGIYRGSRGAPPNTAYGVVWDAERSLVWIDTNRDFDFRDEQPLSDINQSFSTTLLHRDSSAAHPQSSVSVAVLFDSGGRSIHLYEGNAKHQTMVASTAAGQHLLGGASNGVAPGARLVIVSAGGTLAREIESFVRAERDPRIDLITCSQVGESFPAAGESIESLILTRAIARYHKPIFAAADNAGPVMTVTGEPAAAPALVSVGASVERATYQVHFGWDIADTESLVPYSSRGPSRAGALKPDLLAPPLVLTGQPCSDAIDTQGPTRYVLPKCYMLGGGTSNATPAAAGAGAVLISAAKQRHLPYDAQHIAWAMRTGAHPLPGYGPYEQGNGLVDLVRSWELLQKAPAELPVIETSAPVRTRLARYMRDPGRGVGLYEREGWTAGDTGTRFVTLTRRTGPVGDVRYAIRLDGDDGTFTVPAAVTLRRDVAARVAVHVAPRMAGVHSAALRLLDRATALPVHTVLATIVAAEQFNAANGYTVRVSRHVPFPRSTSVFVNVPPGTAMMRIALQVGRGRYRLRTEDSEFGDDIEWQTYFKAYRYPFGVWKPLTTGQSGVQLFPNPRPGVWELLVEPYDAPTFGGDSAQYHVAGDIELTATVVRVVPAAVTATEMTWTNRFGPLGSAVVRAELGVRRTGRVTVDSMTGAVPVELTVEPGTTTLRVEATPAADTTADVDLYLYDCTGNRCYLWDLDRGLSATKALLVRVPAAGSWKLLLDPAHVPTGRTPVAYTVTVTNPVDGTVDVAGDSVARQGGERWSTQFAAHATRKRSDSAETVVVADVIDASAEAAEQAHPLAVFGGRAYRPAAAATIVVPLSAP